MNKMLTYIRAKALFPSINIDAYEKNRCVAVKNLEDIDLRLTDEYISYLFTPDRLVPEAAVLEIDHTSYYTIKLTILYMNGLSFSQLDYNNLAIYSIDLETDTITKIYNGDSVYIKYTDNEVNQYLFVENFSENDRVIRMTIDGIDFSEISDNIRLRNSNSEIFIYLESKSHIDINVAERIYYNNTELAIIKETLTPVLYTVINGQSGIYGLYNHANPFKFWINIPTGYTFKSITLENNGNVITLTDTPNLNSTYIIDLSEYTGGTVFVNLISDEALPFVIITATDGLTGEKIEGSTYYNNIFLIGLGNILNFESYIYTNNEKVLMIYDNKLSESLNSFTTQECININIDNSDYFDLQYVDEVDGDSTNYYTELTLHQNAKGSIEVIIYPIFDETLYLKVAYRPIIFYKTDDGKHKLATLTVQEMQSYTNILVNGLPTTYTAENNSASNLKIYSGDNVIYIPKDTLEHYKIYYLIQYGGDAYFNYLDNVDAIISELTTNISENFYKFKFEGDGSHATIFIYCIEE